MSRLAGHFLGNFRRALITAAVVVPLLGGGALYAASAQASAGSNAAAHATAVHVAAAHVAVTQVAAADPPCSNAGDLCFWVNANYGGNKGLLAGSNGNWGIYSQSECNGGTWNDCASSAYNDGNTDAVRVWQNINGTGGFYCFADHTGLSDFVGHNFSNGAGLNDAISSNYWRASC